MRRLAVSAATAAVLAVCLVLLGGNAAVPAHATVNLNVHVHDDYFHPAGAFLVGPSTSHPLAQAACAVAQPDPQCDARIRVGDTITWVAPSPFAANLHSVTECSDNTFTTCGASVDPVNPINDSGIRAGPLPGPSGWPYGPVQFNTPGTFYYRCEVHPATMRGRVLVLAGSVGGEVEQLTSGSGGVQSAASDSSFSTQAYLLIAGLGAVLAVIVATSGAYAWKRVRRE
jgi:plastocyanin